MLFAGNNWKSPEKDHTEDLNIKTTPYIRY